MPADLRVVAGLDHESAGQLPLHVHRPRVVLRKTSRVFGLPVRDVAAVERFGNQERRLRPGRPTGVPVERGAGRKGRRGHVVPADEAVPVRASARVLDRSERARGTETSDRVGVHAVHSAHSWAEPPRPRLVHRLLSRPSRTFSRELRRAEPAARGRVRQVRVEVRISVGVMPLPGGRRVFVPHSVIDGELVVQAPVVLRVARVVPPAIGHVAIRGDLGRLHFAEQERGERVSCRAGGVERAVGQEAGGRAAIEVVRARRRVPSVSVVVVLLHGEAELPGVFRFHPGKVVGHRPEIVARPSPLGSAPVQIVVRKINQRKQQIGARHVLETDLRSPSLVAIVGSAELPPVVVPERHAVEERRADHAIPIRSIHVRVRVLVAEVVQRHRQPACGTTARRNHEHFAPMEEKSEPIVHREVVIELDAEFVPRVRADGVTRRVDEIVAHARQVGPHGRQVQHLARDLAEPVGRDDISRKRHRGRIPSRSDSDESSPGRKWE